MKSGNPTLNDHIFDDLSATSKSMTVQGTINKVGLLLLLVIVASIWSWNKFTMSLDDLSSLMPILWGSLIGGFVVGLITCFVKKVSPITAPIYAVLEGIVLGIISAMFEKQYPGIAFQAIILTFGVMAIMLVAYKTGLIKVTPKFTMFVIIATGAIALLYIVDLIMSLVFHMPITFLHDSGWLSIAVSLFVIGIAALNLVLDFHFIDKGVEEQAPKYMEWYLAFGLMVTLIWLYLEILRLLAKARSR